MQFIEGYTVKDGIVKAISSIPDSIVYDEKQSQGINLPCYIIHQMPVVIEPGLYRLQGRVYSFEIHWIQDDLAENKYENCARIGHHLVELLEHVQTSDGLVIRARQMGYEIIENELHFNVQYPLRLIRPLDEPAMQTADIKGGIK